MPENRNYFELGGTALKHDKLWVFDQGVEELPVQSVWDVDVVFEWTGADLGGDEQSDTEVEARDHDSKCAAGFQDENTCFELLHAF